MLRISTTLLSFIFVVVVVVFVLICDHGVAASTDDETDPAYWARLGQEDVSRALHKQPINKRAKNVIFFLGDGMGVSTVSAARIYNGQLQNKTGEEGLLFFEHFPNIAHVKTYNLDSQTPDSAATATAFLSGVKANMGTLGVDGSVPRNNCTAQRAHEISSILHWSQNAGKDVGVVTTTRITHATPAATYAHSASRSWEGDSEMSSVEGNCSDIAKQLVDDNPNIKVILGGGRRYFLRESDVDPETGRNDTSDGRKDGRNLVEDWLADKQSRNFNAEYVWNASSFYNVDVDNTDFLLGLFESSHMSYELQRTSTPTTGEAGEPSLEEMTSTAIRMLRKASEGFFLLVEGGRIDHAHHGNLAKLSLADTVAFDKAVRKAAELTSQEDTLIVVTADHSHVFAIAGYQARGNPITGKTGSVGTDGLPYTTLVYGNGPGYSHVNDTRANITDIDTEDESYRSQAAVPLSSETHAAEDVAVYARGPMAHLFHATHEQSYIPYVMAYASCVGMYSTESECAAALEATSSAHVTGVTTSALVFGFVLSFIRY